MQWCVPPNIGGRPSQHSINSRRTLLHLFPGWVFKIVHGREGALTGISHKFIRSALGTTKAKPKKGIAMGKSFVYPFCIRPGFSFAFKDYYILSQRCHFVKINWKIIWSASFVCDPGKLLRTYPIVWNTFVSLVILHASNSFIHLYHLNSNYIRQWDLNMELWWTSTQIFLIR